MSVPSKSGASFAVGGDWPDDGSSSLTSSGPWYSPGNILSEKVVNFHL